jgi:ankyrin repeat protein
MLLCEFAGNDNAAGLARLLDLGLSVDAPYRHADGYFDITPETTALHNAAWRGAHDAVELLVARGANVDARDAKGRTPLMQAIRAATESYWMNRRSPRSVTALIDAGATKDGVRLPTGYDEADALLRLRG